MLEIGVRLEELLGGAGRGTSPHLMKIGDSHITPATTSAGATSVRQVDQDHHDDEGPWTKQGGRLSRVKHRPCTHA